MRWALPVLLGLSAVIMLVPGAVSAQPSTRPGETFQECPDCPEMVVVPAGSYMMGSPETEAGRLYDEGPQRRVVIALPFAVGKFEITFGQWDACVAAGGCAPEGQGPYRPSDRGWGRDTRPVISVSWDEAKIYVRWLNERVGGSAYRLLSEAEWEYAARGNADGSADDTPYPWGDAASHENANYGADQWSPDAGLAQGRDQWVHTSPVGSFPPNAFGLHDMQGNVWEWVEDCVGPYNRLPTNGSANTCQGWSPPRVIRGGSWFDGPQELRSANRNSDAQIMRRSIGFIGFRVARTL